GSWPVDALELRARARIPADRPVPPNQSSAPRADLIARGAALQGRRSPEVPPARCSPPAREGSAPQGPSLARWRSGKPAGRAGFRNCWRRKGNTDRELAEERSTRTNAEGGASSSRR